MGWRGFGAWLHSFQVAYALVLCGDEKSQIQNLERTQPMLPMGLRLRRRRDATTTGAVAWGQTLPPPRVGAPAMAIAKAVSSAETAVDWRLYRKAATYSIWPRSGVRVDARVAWQEPKRCQRANDLSSPRRGQHEADESGVERHVRRSGYHKGKAWLRFPPRAHPSCHGPRTPQ